MSDLVVRVYNVRFGDAVLVTIPETAGGHAVTRNILFDFGNALGTAGGEDDVFAPVIDDIIARLAGKPLDLYVMTHEHLDHVQGLFYAAQQLNKRIKVKRAWLTGSARPGYYDTHPDARKQKIAALTAYQVVRSRLQSTPSRSPFVDILLANNDTSKTSKCVDFLRDELTQPEDVHYVDRTSNLSGLQPSTSAQITLWGPEEDTADYYGAFRPLAAALRIGADMGVGDVDPDASPVPESDLPRPPSGVDAGAFYNLLDVRHENSASTLLSIDHASNNTSIVLLLEWKGWKLLFSGDAEKRSWRTMNKNGLIQPVHFLKVSHHGSHTGMLPVEILDKLLPMPPPAGPRRAAVSTFLHTYPGVPNQDTLDELARRADLKSTLDLAAGELSLEFRFSSAGP